MLSEGPRSIHFPVMKIVQPIGEFYIGCINSNDLVSISDFDVRKIQQSEGIDEYLGIQRAIDQTRVREIRQYIQGDDANFPTSVVLAVPEECVELAVETTAEGSSLLIMTLSNNPSDDPESEILYRQIARVIDGQHRIEGLRGFPNNFQMNVSIFVGADISDQASIFSTVNLAQTKVNKSLVYDLFELSNSRSPERSCHNVIVSLDRTDDSPLYKKIKRLGTATEGRFGETLSQATVVAGILQYICKDRIEVLRDRQIGRRGGRFPQAGPADYRKVFLRPMFIAEDDIGIAELLWNYFEAVKLRWPEAWSETGTGNMLNRTNGFNALMRLFRYAYLHFAEPGQSVNVEQFSRLFTRSRLLDSDFNPVRFPPGTTGSSRLYTELLGELQLQAV